MMVQFAVKRCAMIVNHQTNQEINNLKNAQLDFELSLFDEHRWKEDRRREPSEGYTYISTVGWIDRRERLRRKVDPYNFF